MVAAVAATASIALLLFSSSMTDATNHALRISLLSGVQSRLVDLEIALESRLQDRAGAAALDPADALKETLAFLSRASISIDGTPPKVIASVHGVLRGLDAERAVSPDPGDDLRTLERIKPLLFELSRVEREELRLFDSARRDGARIQNVAFGIFLVAILTAVAGAVYILRSYSLAIVRPIVCISRSATRMAEGDLSAECPETGPKELAQLAGSLNNMARSLRVKIGQLRDTVVKEQRVVRQLAVLNDISSLFFSELDLNRILGIIVQSGRDLIRAEYAVVVLVDQHRRVTHFRTSILDEEDPRILKEPRGILKRVLDEKIPIRINSPLERPDGVEFPEGHPVIRNLLAVPIIVDGQVIGEFVLGNRIGEEGFSEDDEDQALHFSFQAALGIEKAMLHQEVLRMAQTDGLTGLMNHRTFQERLAQEISRALRYDRPLTLLLLDIDRFKQFNDTFGHQAGDEILKRLGCILLESIRTIDGAARYGGEEFALILSETGFDGGLKSAQRILREARRARLNDNHMEDLPISRSITVSVGMAVFPEDGETREELIRAADTALYSAKRRGRNRVVSYREITVEPPIP